MGGTEDTNRLSEGRRGVGWGGRVGGGGVGGAGGSGGWGVGGRGVQHTTLNHSLKQKTSGDIGLIVVEYAAMASLSEV